MLAEPVLQYAMQGNNWGWSRAMGQSFSAYDAALALERDQLSHNGAVFFPQQNVRNDEEEDKKGEEKKRQKEREERCVLALRNSTYAKLDERSLLRRICRGSTGLQLPRPTLWIRANPTLRIGHGRNRGLPAGRPLGVVTPQNRPL